MLEEKQNILRSRLITKDTHYTAQNLYQDFIHMEERAYNTWIPALGHDKGSHSGSTHLKNVEALICNLLDRIPEIQLTPWEAFILLSAILFHDIGRAISDARKKPLLEDMENGEGEYVSNKSDNHAYCSYLFIKAKDNELGISLDPGIAECVARVCGAHDTEFAEDLRRRGNLEEIFLDRFGRIRIGWLGCLLSLGDELDNSYHRAMPDWVRYLPDEVELIKATNDSNSNYEHLVKCPVQELFEPESSVSKGNIRKQIQGCEVNLVGRLMIVYPPNNLKANMFEKHNKDDNVEKLKKRIWEDLKKKKELLRFWRRQLRQMHLEMYAAAVSVDGYLFGCRDKPYDFELIVEPVLRDMKVTRILDAAIQLRFNSFGKTTFPWETLATEAGIERVQEAKLIFHRLAMLSIYYNQSPKSKSNKLKIIFTELDGEWTIDIEDKKTAENKITDAEKAIYTFHAFISEIIENSTNRILEKNQKQEHTANTNKESDSDIISEKKLVIENADLAYLFDEDGKDNYKGIVFPESQSKLFMDTGKPKIGINMVISGPAGVGKSTLAMELIARSKIYEYANIKDVCMHKKTVCAYYSLEQPLESIQKLALGLNLKDENIISFHPNPSEQNSINYEIRYVNLYRDILESIPQKGNDHVLLLPKLAPHSYGDSPDEEQLFWFRYKQVARLIEAHRAYQVKYNKDFSLSIIVLDNLNALSHHPLARQRVHQLFRLIAWGGVLGIHIVEHTPSEKFQVFQDEVEALSDIVVHLDWSTQEYRYKTIEVIKSRCQRNVLGRHPFKIRRKTTDESLREKEGSIEEDTSTAGFTVFPSLHTQVVRNEKINIEKSDNNETNNKNARIGKNEDLCKLVHKSPTESGLGRDAFIVLSGRSGGHKLALGLDYIHGKSNSNIGLVLNMGQPILYNAVAGCKSWWKDKYNQNIGKSWPHKKVFGDFYFLRNKQMINDSNIFNPPLGSVVVLNFQPGFLLPEEFINTILIYLDNIKNNGMSVDRVLFNSTAHLSSRFPLLDKDPLMLTALVQILKKRGISLMVIAVEEIGHQEKIESLAAMADAKLNIHHLRDERVPRYIMSRLEKVIEKGCHSARIISSDNVTGKDYRKNYGLLDVSKNEPKLEIKIINNRVIRNNRNRG